MESKNMDYCNSKIYQVLNNVTNDVYVGSTTQPLSKRLGFHRLCSKTKKNPLYECMRKNGADNFYIELIESFPCKSKEELLQREGYHKRLLGGTLHKK